MMMVTWTLRPRRVDELVVNVLLAVFDDLLEVPSRILNMLSETDGVRLDQPIVFGSDCGVQVVKKQADYSILVVVSNGHFSVRSPWLVHLTLPLQLRRHIIAPAAVGCKRLLGLKDGGDLAAKFGNPMADDVPDEIVVDAKVVVNETVAHAGHRAPVDVRVFGPEFG